jgi:hypothetical protein
MSEWKLSAGRITLFPATPTATPASAFDLYRRVWNGEDPDNFQRQASPILPTFAQGRRSGIHVGCLIHQTRIDFNLSPIQTNTMITGPESLPLFSDGRQLRREMINIIEAIGSGAAPGPFNRVAINIEFKSPQDSAFDANSAITTVMPEQYRVRLTNEENFLLQVNQPYTNSAAGGTKVNSITKWSVDRLQVVTIAVPVSPVPGPIPTSAGPAAPKIIEITTASVSFEQNSVPPNHALTHEEEATLLRDALSQINQAQQDVGIDVKGLGNV